MRALYGVCRNYLLPIFGIGGILRAKRAAQWMERLK